MNRYVAIVKVYVEAESPLHASDRVVAAMQRGAEDNSDIGSADVMGIIEARMTVRELEAEARNL